MSGFRAELTAAYGQEIKELRDGIQRSVDDFITDVTNPEFLKAYGRDHDREVNILPLEWQSENLSVLPLTLYEMQNFAVESFRKAKLGGLEAARVVSFTDINNEAAEAYSVTRAWRYPTADATIFIFEQNWLPGPDYRDTGLGLRVTNFIPDFAYPKHRELFGGPDQIRPARHRLRAAASVGMAAMTRLGEAWGFGRR